MRFMNYVSLKKLPAVAFLQKKLIFKLVLGTIVFISFSQQSSAQCTLVCNDTTLVCTADFDAFTLGFPTVTDCMGSVIFDTSSVITNLGCNDPSGNYLHIERTWTVTDSVGGTDDCLQNIFIKKGDLADVELDLELDEFCENYSNPLQNFFPEIGGHPIDGGNNCNIIATITGTAKLDSCDINIFKFSRAWSVKDQCTGDSVLLNQKINFIDTEGPTLICPDPIVFETVTGLCYGNAQLPDPVIKNNCTAAESVFIEIPTIGFGLTSFDNIQKGQYDVIYKAVDCASDTGSCTTTLSIIDTETPTAVCREFTVISLTSAPFVEVPAISFDEGSYDNCDDVGILASRNGLDFYERVRFDCLDIGIDSIMVVLQVFEKNNPDNFDRCMAFAKLNDKLAPTINCPRDRTIDCEDDYTDLSVFGTATASDACDFLISETSVENITNCGTGTIVRTFTARDSSGNENSCTQTIFIENLLPSVITDVVFPKDSIFKECNPVLHPDSLPVAYSRPIFPNDPCSMYMVNYSDQRFDVSFPACFKVFRTWRVMEMCSGQEFSHVQELKVMDNIKPDLTCPKDTIVAADYDCTNTAVILAPATATDCDSTVNLSWISDFDTGQTGNASGEFPVGVTTIVFKAKDRCGNVSNCQTTVEVKDLTGPTVKAHQKVSIELGIAGGVIDARLEAAALNVNSKDNCSLSSNLEYFIRRYSLPNQGLPTTQSILFDCDDIGLDTVEFWAMDEAGNSDYVVVVVEVQDNFNRCPGSSSSSKISGYLKTEDDMPLEGISVHLHGNASLLTFTDSLGYYEFNDLPKGENYTVTPFKNDDASEGISTFDLILMSRHILNVEPLNTPFKMIAGDANKSANISTADMIAIRRVILRTTDEFPANTTWRFIDQSYQFRQPLKPLSENLPPTREITDLQNEISNIDFVGIKVGDINGTISQNIQNRTNDELFKIQFEKDENGVVWVKSTEQESLEGLQFSMKIGENEIEGLEFLPGVITDFSDNNFSVFEKNNLLISWSGGAAISPEGGDKLFGFKVENNTPVEPKMTDVIAPEVYSNGFIRNFELVKKEIEIEEEPELIYELLQNKPNPFKQSTQIGFRLPEPTKAKVTIFDLSGNIVKIVTGEFEKGLHQIRLNKNELTNAGVYFYKLETPKFTSTKKMILL